MSAFNDAMDRIEKSGMDNVSLVHIFRNLLNSAIIAETVQAAITLGFTEDANLEVGDYIPTFTLSVVKVTDELLENKESPVTESPVTE